MGAATDTGFTYDFRKTGVAGDVNYQTFGCNVFQESPPTPDKLTPEALGAHHKAEIEKWWPIIKAANIKGD